ncbi:gliding motility lipoprotein GldB [Sphingobacterium oryzagri]|uniref:Gliding motility lipoprotein GldB n=1 Tax=Sphingobacterium oryzagri TaxID=3025669 RepID=A0ABY7WF71_9SPHI|nr:gliding motility lipoprotein GldB [Sphingobacterium sp. KACC 22765]WDF68257.1 gliding motility lipoprotein GldB [Sphingobacterium sp. KACC 22765]
MNPKKIVIIPLLVSLFFLYACQSEKKLPDVSAIPVKVHVERFDQELSKLKPAQILSSNQLWLKKYGYFYDDYMQYMLEVGSAQDTSNIAATLTQILQQRDFKALSAAVAKAYPDMEKQEKELTQAFKYLRYYFPAYEMPRFIAFFSGFSVQVPLGEGYVGIGLDMFLGADSEFYPALVKTIPRYLSKRFTAENVTPRVVEAVLRQTLYPQEDTDVNTLQHMVYQGKVLLALDSILPHTADSLKIGYSAQQMTWAKAYQAEVWSWFLQENLLYSTDYLRIQKYFTEAPFTAELGENNASAPKLGVYMGWQLVRKYMAENPEITLNQLLANTDAQAILEKSRFKGK